MYVYAEKITGGKFTYPEEEGPWADSVSEEAIKLWNQPNRPFGN
jgi:hypothetical protein